MPRNKTKHTQPDDLNLDLVAIETEQRLLDKVSDKHSSRAPKTLSAKRNYRDGTKNGSMFSLSAYKTEKTKPMESSTSSSSLESAASAGSKI